VVLLKNLILVAIFVLPLVLLAQPGGAQDGLVGYWTFDEGDGEEVDDSSGMENHGILVGDIDWVDGKFGTALQFSQSQSCVKIEHSESINLIDEVTIAVWLKPEADQPDWAKPMCKQKSGEYPYSLQYDDSSRLFGTVNADARFDTMPHLDNFTEWAHLAYTYNGEAGILYKDGEEVARVVANGELQQNNLELTIGSRLNSSQSFVGIIDDARLYNRALSQNEIKKVMEGGTDMAVSASGKLAVTWGYIRD
jgi:hypothetical protein